jgi:hypothetical protein
MVTRTRLSVTLYYIAASLVPSHDTSRPPFVFGRMGSFSVRYECRVLCCCAVVLLCWWSYMIQRWQGSGADGGSWHHINCTCSAGPPYWARGKLTSHKSDSLIYQKKRSKKWMKSSFLFPACAFRSPCVSFLYIVLGDLCQARYKMLGDDFYSFYIRGLYVFLLSSRYISLLFFILILSVFWENSVDKSTCQAWLRSIKEDIGRLQFQRAVLSRKSLSVRMKSFKTERLPSLKLVQFDSIARDPLQEFVHEMDQVTGGWTNCEARSFITCTACWILWG